MISNEQTAVLKTCQEEQPSSVCDPFVHVNLTLSKEPTKMWIFLFFFAWTHSCDAQIQGGVTFKHLKQVLHFFWETFSFLWCQLTKTKSKFLTWKHIPRIHSFFLPCLSPSGWRSPARPAYAAVV